MSVMSVNRSRRRFSSAVYIPATGETSKVYKTKYYAENVDKIRANAREYSKRLRSDPVQKKLINAKKRELMRQLKLRRQAEQRDEKIIMESESYTTASSSEDPLLEFQEEYLADDVTEYVLVEAVDPELKEEPEGEETLFEEGEDEIIVRPQSTTLETENRAVPVEEEPEAPNEKQDEPTNHFPFASGIADCLEGEDQRKFISYIEDIAQLYFKHFGIGRLDKSKLPLLLMTR